MNRTDATDHLNNTFTDGNPQQGQPATVVNAKFLNAVQSEIVNAILAAGLVPSDADVTQLAQAIRRLAIDVLVPDRAWRIGGLLIVQVGSVRASFTTEQTVAVTYPTSFPTFSAWPMLTGFGGGESDNTVLNTSRSLSGFTMTVNASVPTANNRLDGFDYLTIGY